MGSVVDDAAAAASVALGRERDNPLLAPLQARLKAQLRIKASRVGAALLDKTEQVKRFTKQKEQIGVDLYGSQQQLARMQLNLEKTHDRFNMFNRLRANVEQERGRLADLVVEKQHERAAAQTKAKALQNEGNLLNETVRQITLHNERVQSEILVTRRAAYAEEAEMVRVEKEKSAQDYLIDSMTQQIKQQTHRVDVLNQQISAQKAETSGARDTIRLALQEMAQITGDKTDHMSKWKSAVIAMGRRDQALEAAQKQRAQLQVEIQRLEAEFEGYQKSLRAEQLTSEKLTEVLTKIITDTKFLEGQIESIQSKKGSIIQEYDLFRNQIDANDKELQDVMSQQKLFDLELSRIEKRLSASQVERKQIENQILDNLSNQTTFEQGAQNTYKAVVKLRKQIEEKEQKIASVENEIARIRVDSLNTEAHNKDLKRTFEEFDGKLRKKDELIVKLEKEIFQRTDIVQKKQIVIDGLNKKYEAMTKDILDEDNTGPLEATILSIGKEIQESRDHGTSLQRAWIQTQTELVEVVSQTEKEAAKVQEMSARQTILRQKALRIERLTDSHLTDIAELRRSTEAIHAEITKLNVLLTEFKARQKDLQGENYNKEIEYERNVEVLEQRVRQGATKIDEIKSAKEELLVQLAEIEEHILIWERKIEIEKETQKAIDPEFGQSEVAELRKEIHRMELKLQNITKKQDELMEQSLRNISKQGDIEMRHLNSKRSDLTAAALRKKLLALGNQLKLEQRQIRATDQEIQKQEEDNRILVDLCEQVQQKFNEVDDLKVSLTQKKQLMEFEKRMKEEFLSILRSVKERHGDGHKIPGQATQIERIELLKDQIRKLKSQFHQHEPYFDVLLSLSII